MKPTESKSVQKRIIKYASEIGWRYVIRSDSEARRGFNDKQVANSSWKSEIYYRDILLAKIREFNPWLPANYKLPKPLSKIEGNREMLNFLRGQTTAYDESEKRERNVVFINFEHPERNIFEVTDEFTFSNSHYTTRQDIVFLINGIPLIDLECKNLTTANGIEKAIDDNIRRYHAETPELMTVEQLFLVSEGTELEYGVTWNTTRRNIFEWKGDKVAKLENKIKTFFEIKHVLNLIEKYIMFVEKNEKLNKLILAEHQTKRLKWCWSDL